jgi:tetratricopeptide (TPR) repeat protein
MIGCGPRPPTTRYRQLLAWSIPVAAALLVCLPAYRGEFIWDDRGLYLADNELMRRADGPWRFWFTTDCVDYYPLTYTAFWLEWRFVGADPRLYHAVNFGLHAAATGLLMAVLRRLAVPAAWLVGLLFAVHPLQVESVAWISQQKTLLATALGFAAVLELLRWERTTGGWAGPRGLGWFALSLAAKPVFITLPLVVAARLAWRRELHRRPAIVLVVGLCLIALVFGLVGIPFQLKGFKPDVRGQDFPTRLASLGWTAWFYVGQTIRFWEPCFIYPRWPIDGHAPTHWLPNLGILAATAALGAGRTRLGDRPLAAWLVYLVTMLPALGVVDVGFWQFSYVADHYVYQSLPALLILLLDAARLLARRVPWQPAADIGVRSAGLVACAGCIVAATMAAVSWRRAADYRTEAGLWQHTVALNPAAEIAWYGLAREATRRQDFARAEECHRRALALEPDIDRSWKAFGDVLRERRKWPEARDAYARCLALATQPGRIRVLAALGLAAAEIRLASPRAGLDLLSGIVAAECDRARLPPHEQADLLARAAVYRLTALRALGETAAAQECAAALDRLLTRSPDVREPVARACAEMDTPPPSRP